MEDLPSEQEILRYADTHCPEPHTLVSSEKGEGKAEIIYYFETDRGLEFTVKSFVSDGFLSDDTIGMRNTYTDAVRGLYEAEVEQILRTSLSQEVFSRTNLFAYLHLDITSYEELASVSRAVEELNELWAGELEFMEHDFPLAVMDVNWVQLDSQQQSTRSVEIEEIQIDGSQDQEAVLAKLQESYLSLYDTGEILSSKGISEEHVKGDRILQRLYPVTINGVTYSEGGDGGKNTVFYNEERATYLIRFGQSLSTSFTRAEPWRILQETADLDFVVTSNSDQSGGYFRDRSVNVSGEWNIEDTTWRLTLETNKNFLGMKRKSVVLEKDGKAAEDIEFIDLYPDTQDESGLIYAVSLEDFCEMLNLTYSIDNDMGSIEFTTVS